MYFVKNMEQDLSQKVRTREEEDALKEDQKETKKPCKDCDNGCKTNEKEEGNVPSNTEQAPVSAAKMEQKDQLPTKITAEDVAQNILNIERDKSHTMSCAMGDPDKCVCKGNMDAVIQNPVSQQLKAISNPVSNPVTIQNQSIAEENRIGKRNPKPKSEVANGRQQTRQEKITANHARTEKLRRDLHRERVQLLKALVPGGYAARNQIEVMDLAIEYICMLSNTPSPLMDETRHGMHMASLRNLSLPTQDRFFRPPGMVTDRSLDWSAGTATNHQPANQNTCALRPNQTHPYSPASALWKGIHYGQLQMMDQAGMQNLMEQLQQQERSHKE